MYDLRDQVRRSYSRRRNCPTSYQLLVTMVDGGEYVRMNALIQVAEPHLVSIDITDIEIR